MRDAARRLDFEQAAELRDRVRAAHSSRAERHASVPQSRRAGSP